MPNDIESKKNESESGTVKLGDIEYKKVELLSSETEKFVAGHLTAMRGMLRMIGAPIGKIKVDKIEFFNDGFLILLTDNKTNEHTCLSVKTEQLEKIIQIIFGG